MATVEQMHEPSGAERQAIVDILDRHTAEHGLEWNPDNLALVAMDAGRIVGGLLGNTNWGWLCVRVLAVHPDQRGEGLGRTLVERAERIARDRGCRGAWLNTKGFQAPGFYEHLGYEVFGTLDCDSPELTRILMRKRLRA